MVPLLRHVDNQQVCSLVMCEKVINLPLWRPKNRTEWWLAFLTSLTAIPFAFVMVGLGAAQTLNIPQLYLIGLVAGPIFSCYLLGVTRLPLPVKIIAIPIVFAAISFTYLPRSSCGEESSVVAESECR